jgi:ribosomal protein S18 acetylase RimI-like enzyme
VDLETLAHRLRLAERTYLTTACEVTPFPWGVAVRNADVPLVHRGNLLYVDGWPDDRTVDDVLADVDPLYGAVGVDHRTVVFRDPEEAFRLQEAFAAAGFGARAELLMAHLGVGACYKNRAVDVREVTDDADGRRDLASLRNVVRRDRGYADAVVAQLERLAAAREEALGTRAFVGYLDGEPAGYATLRVDDDVAVVEALGTAPAFRMHGLGMTMTGEMVNRGRWAGCGVVGLTTDAFGVAKAMYEKCGFVVVGEIRSFFRPGVADPAP